MSGQLFIVAAPSGAGKTTLVKRLLNQAPDICLSISFTTRLPRSGEENGREYHFVDVGTFHQMRESNDFLEWAEVHGNFYGTSRRWIKDRLAGGKDVLLEIDWQGAAQVRGLFSNSVGIFILPPSLEALRQRLIGRDTDSPDIIERRLAAARDEMRHVREFDYVIINDDLETALGELQAVFVAHGLRTERQQLRQARLLDSLLQA